MSKFASMVNVFFLILQPAVLRYSIMELINLNEPTVFMFMHVNLPQNKIFWICTAVTVKIEF